VRKIYLFVLRIIIAGECTNRWSLVLLTDNGAHATACRERVRDRVSLQLRLYPAEPHSSDYGYHENRPCQPEQRSLLALKAISGNQVSREIGAFDRRRNENPPTPHFGDAGAAASQLRIAS